MKWAKPKTPNERAHDRMVEMESAETERRPVRPTGGFTLVEMIVAISIAVVVMGGLLSVFIMSLRAWKEGSRDLSLQSSGRLIIEKIVRGPGGRFGLREAAENDVAADEDGKGIRFSVDKNNPPTYSKLDDTELRIYLEGNRIMYDPSTGVQGDEVPIVGFGPVKDVRFTVNEKAVTVELWMSDTSGSIHPSQVKVATTVFLRKSEDPDTQT